MKSLRCLFQMLICLANDIAMAALEKFLVAGDSFVRRLQSHQNRFNGTTLSVRGRVVDMKGYSGKGVRDVRLYLQNMSQSVYSVICLSVGGNDLCCASRTPAHVVSDLLSLAQELVSAGSVQVIICQLLHRASTSHFEGLSLAEYNDRVDRVNFLLQQNCVGPVKFRQHHRSVLGCNRLDGDGVHLNISGMNGFRHSVIAALSSGA